MMEPTVVPVDPTIDPSLTQEFRLPTAADIAADMRGQLATVSMLMREINHEYTSKPRLRDIAGGLAMSYASMVSRLMQIAEAQPADSTEANNG